MLIEDLYKTKKTILIVDSTDDFVFAGMECPVYMNEASTIGILDTKERFLPLSMLHNIGIDWEYLKEN